MKKLFLAFVFLASQCFGAAAYDTYLTRRNSGNTANEQVTVTPSASSFLTFDASKTPIGTKAVPSGDVVGTTDTQTLTNKTLTSPAINGGTITGATSISQSNGFSLSGAYNSRRPTQGLVFDGTAGATISVNPGGSSVSISFVFTPSSVSGNRGVLYAAPPYIGTVMFTSGVPRIYNGTKYISAGVSSEIGKTDTWSFVADGTNSRWYKNGTQVSVEADGASYTQTLISLGFEGISSSSLSGTLGPVSIINAALSAAEVATLAETGRLPSWCHSAQVGQPAGVGLITGDNSTFASDTGFWVKVGGATITGGKGVAASAGDGFGFNTLISGLKYRATFTITDLVGTIAFNSGTGTTFQTISSNGTYTIEWTAVSQYWRLVANTASSFKIDDATSTPLGSVLNLDPDQPGSGNVWRNINGTGDVILPSTGVRWALPTTQLERVDILTRTQSSARRQMIQLSGSQGASTATIPAPGTAPIELFAEMDIPASNPSTAQLPIIIGSYGAANSLDVYLATNGNLNLDIFDGSSGLKTYIIPAVSLYGGQHIRVSWQKDSAGVWTAKVNGSSINLATAGSGDATASLTGTMLRIGAPNAGNNNNAYVGSLTVSLLLGNLTAAESARWHATGEFPAWALVSGGVNGSSVIPSDFSTGWLTDTPSNFTAGVAGTFTNTANAYRTNAMVVGRNYVLTLTIDSSSGGNLQYYDGAGYNILANGAGTFSVQFKARGTLFVLQHSDTGSMVVSSPRLIVSGLAFHPDERWDGRGGVWPDVSGAFGRGLVLATSGVTPAVLSNGTNRILATTSTKGNQQLYGASIIPGVAQIIRVRAKAASGTPTVTLGNASGGSQIVTSVALSTSWKNLTIVSGGEITSTANLWASSTSTDTVYWDIEVQSFNN